MATATVKGSFLTAARQFTENLYHCSRCNYCVEASWEEKGLRHVCPTLLYHSPALSYSGKGYLATARALADGEELSAATVADRAFACTTCGNCEEACPIGLRPAQLVKAMRADLVDHGLAPDSALEIASNIAGTGNPQGLPAAERYTWASELRTDSGSAPEFLYLPGCAACYGKPAEARATVALLTAAGVRVAMLAGDRDRCCGAPLFETGQLAAGRRQGIELLEAIRNSGATAVLTSGAECLESLRSHYPQYSVRVTSNGRATAAQPPFTAVRRWCQPDPRRRRDRRFADEPDCLDRPRPRPGDRRAGRDLRRTTRGAGARRSDGRYRATYGSVRNYRWRHRFAWTWNRVAEISEHG
jgi:heterodisulfide reductase subunit C